MSDLLPILTAISVFSNRVAEGAKSLLKAHYPTLKPETVSEVALFVSLLAGVLGALALNVNLLALFPDSPYLKQVSPLVGIILTGCIASVGSEGIQFIMGLLQAKQTQMSATTTSSSVQLSATSATVTPAPSSTSTPEQPAPSPFPPSVGNSLR